VRTCEGCQFYARKSNLPAHVLQTIPITWPFAVWGLDIVGPLWKAPGGYTHLSVAIDKFSKWVEVCPITNLRAEHVGDSPRGPLKQRGNPHLNPATTSKHAKPNHAGN
jgi:hypothetical protein